ncbi:hypothetical protein T4B_11397 [Trichinella pseudospiralis]|uniref:Uncharacterized protein n=1 Tax=Trichinella pseudospiralis TaxID=6337 RepID=A0A0V1IZ88_TRIPS|nr:hypothetical protein T4B_11397 [Trichinella pseudospiralis]
MLTKNFGWENFVVKVRNNFISCFNNAIMKSSFCSAFAFSVINTYSMHNRLASSILSWQLGKT